MKKKIYILLLTTVLIFNIQSVGATSILDMKKINGLTYKEIVGADLWISSGNAITNNLVRNGNFENNTIGWSIVDSSYTYVENGKLRVKTDGTSAYQGASQDRSNFQTTVNDKLYIYYEVEKIGAQGEIGFQAEGNVYKNNNSEEWEKGQVSDIFITNDNDGYLYIKRYYSTSDFYTDNVVILNLTDIFGFGNEPTDTKQLDEMVAYYIDNDVSILNDTDDYNQSILEIDTEAKDGNPIDIFQEIQDLLYTGGRLSDITLNIMTTPILEFGNYEISILGMIGPSVIISLMGFALIKKFVPLA